MRSAVAASSTFQSESNVLRAPARVLDRDQLTLAWALLFAAQAPRSVVALLPEGLEQGVHRRGSVPDPWQAPAPQLYR